MRLTAMASVILLFLLAAIGHASAATVATDRADYYPFETVVIAGSGWAPGETIEILLQESPETHPDVTVYATADADGNFTNTDFAPALADLGRLFTLTATGQSSGQIALTTFTDATPTRPDCPSSGAGPNAHFEPDPTCPEPTGTGNDCVWGCRAFSNVDHVAGNCHPVATVFVPSGGACDDDGNSCTTDTCDGAGECVHEAKANDTPCTDNNACTQTDSCQEGQCVGGDPVVCVASDQCHDAGTCNSATGACSDPAKPDGTGCSDGDACTQSDTCQSGACVGADPVVCAASDQCHDAGTCNSATGACSDPAKPDGTGCNDSNACTQTDTCQSGACLGGNPKSCDDGIFCTDDACVPADGSCTHDHNDSCQSAVTSSSLCIFDVDATLEGDEFRLIYTPDPANQSASKLNASNPGQFYYNVFYFGDGNETVQLNLPYPFVTQGAVPIHIYSGVTTNEDTTCLLPGTEVANRSTQVTLGSYTPQAFGSTATVEVTLPSLPGGFAYINIHLDYGLKGTGNYAKNATNDAIDATSLVVRIADKKAYTFSDNATPGSDTVISENAFKKNPGIGGILLKNGNSQPMSNVKVEIRDSSNKLAGTVYTDVDGWYMWQYKYTGKAATFTVKVPSSNQSQSVTLKSNGFVMANFNLP
jgi:hypothetical protein